MKSHLVVLALCGLLAACAAPNGSGYGSESSYAPPPSIGLDYFYFSSGHHRTSYGFGFSPRSAYGSGYGLGYNSLAYGGGQGHSVNACYHQDSSGIAQIPCPPPTTRPQEIKYYPCYDTIMGQQCVLGYFY